MSFLSNHKATQFYSIIFAVPQYNRLLLTVLFIQKGTNQPGSQWGNRNTNPRLQVDSQTTVKTIVWKFQTVLLVQRRLLLILSPPKSKAEFAKTVSSVIGQVLTFFARFIYGGVELLLDLRLFHKLAEVNSCLLLIDSSFLWTFLLIRYLYYSIIVEMIAIARAILGIWSRISTILVRSHLCTLYNLLYHIISLTVKFLAFTETLLTFIWYISFYILVWSSCCSCLCILETNFLVDLIQIIF